VRILLVAFAVVSTLYPADLIAQDAEFESRLDAATLAAVRPILDAAERDSLPRQALQSKVLEGLAKDVAPEQIGRVVSGLALELRSARSGLRGRLPDQPLFDGEVVAVATAARHGIGIDVVQSPWASRTDGASLEVPVTVLGELVRRGVPVDDAANLMTHVVATSVPLPVAAQIPGKFDGAIGSGASAAAALGRALRALNIPSPPGRRPRG
jgi:hypothetical protein